MEIHVAEKVVVIQKSFLILQQIMLAEICQWEPLQHYGAFNPYKDVEQTLFLVA